MNLFALLSNHGRSSYGNVTLFILRGNTKFLADLFLYMKISLAYKAYFGFVLPYSTLLSIKLNISVNKYRQLSSCPFAFVCLGH